MEKNNPDSFDNVPLMLGQVVVDLARRIQSLEAQLVNVCYPVDVNNQNIWRIEELTKENEMLRQQLIKSSS